MDEKLLAELKALEDKLSATLDAKAKAEFEAQIKSVKDAISAAQTKAVDDAKTELKAEIKAVKDEHDKLIEAAQNEVKEIQKKQGRISLLGNDFEGESFKSALQKGLREKSEELKNYKKTRQAINIELKTVGDIGSANFTTSGTQTFAGPTQLPGVNRIAYDLANMRDILGTTQISTDSVSLIRGVAGEGGPTSVAAGGLKPQSDADWVKIIVPVTKIAHWYRIPEEWLADVSWLQSDITQTGIAELMKLENSMVISNNAAGEFTGLVQNSTAYSSPSGLAAQLTDVNNYDVLVAAQTQLRNANRNGNFIITDNDAYAKMILTKANTGEYVFGAPNIAMPNVFGVPIYPFNVAALADKFIVGDRNYATIAVREGISVRFYDQDGNNARYNLVTVVIEERIALVVKRTDAFIYGDFSDATTALQTP